MTYLEELGDVIRRLHGADAKHVESVPVKEMFQGKTRVRQCGKGWWKSSIWSGTPQPAGYTPGATKPTIPTSHGAM